MDFSNRSKQHANKNHINQQLQKSQLQQQQVTLPPTPTTIKIIHYSTPNPIPTPDTTYSSTPRSYHNNDVRTSTTLRTYTQNLPKTTTVEIQKSVEIEASSLQSLEDGETVSDESQNIHVTHKNKDYESNAKSPRGNLLHENSEKPYRGKSSQELGKIHQLAKEQDNSTEQRKRLQTYIVSDVTPQSFKPAKEAAYETETSVEFLSSASSSSTTQRYVPVPDPKPFQYSLQSASNGFRLRAENFSPSSAYSNDNQNAPLTQKSIQTTSSTEASTTTTTTPLPPSSTTTATSTTTKPTVRTEAEDFTPTTYAPSQRTWRTPRLNPKPTEKPIKSSTSAYLTSPSPKIFASTERSIQSFTARATVFKDNLTKTTGPPAHRFVSPYKSLETLLGEKEERFGGNNLRTTSKPRFTNAVSSPTPFLPATSKQPPTTKQPLRSYFLITSTPRNFNDVIVTMSTSPRNFSISDAILSTFSIGGYRPAESSTEAMTTRSTTPLTTTTTTTTESTTIASSQEMGRPRGRSRYTAITQAPNLNADEPTTYAPKFRFPAHTEEPTSFPSLKHYRRKVQRTNTRLVNSVGKSREKYQSFKELTQQHESQNQVPSKSINRKPIENESVSVDDGPRAEALVAFDLNNKQDNSIEDSRPESSPASSSSTEQVISITDRPHKYFYSNKYRQQTSEHNLAEGLQNAGYITSSTSRSRFRPKSVLEQLQLFLAGESDESESTQQNDDFTHPEIKAAVEEIKNLYTSTTTTTLRPTTTASPPTKAYVVSTTTTSTTPYNSPTISHATSTSRYTASSTLSQFPRYTASHNVGNTTSTLVPSSTSSSTTVSAAIPTTKSSLLMPVRASRVNNAIKSSIAAAAASSTSNSQASASATTMGHRSHKVINGLSSSSSSSSLASNSNVAATATVKCSDSTSNAKCNEIPSRYLQTNKQISKSINF